MDHPPPYKHWYLACCSLVLRYAEYVDIVHDGPRFPRLALEQAVVNARKRQSSWLGSAQCVLATLPRYPLKSLPGT